MKLYKVLGKGGVACNGGRVKWHLPQNGKPGEWMPQINGELIPCENGYHLCRFENLLDWLNEEIYEAEGRGDKVECDNKIVFREARLICKLGKWNMKASRLFAADCAEHVLHIYEKKYPRDDRPRNCIAAARDFANRKIGKAAVDSAGDAARDAASAAKWDVNCLAAKDAARSASRSAADCEEDWKAAWKAARSATRSANWEKAGTAASAANWAVDYKAAKDAASAVDLDAEKKWQYKKLSEYLETE